MAYFTLALIKKNMDILATDTSLDTELNGFGAEADAWVDEGIEPYIAVPLAAPPDSIKNASSNYAASRFYLKRDPVKSAQLERTAVNARQDYITKLKITGQATKTGAKILKTGGKQ